MHSTLDTIAHTNPLRSHDTRLKIGFALTMMLIIIASPSALPPLIAFIVMSVLILYVVKVKPKTYILLLSPPFLFGLIALIMMSLFFGYHYPLYSFEIFSHTFTVYKDGMSTGLLVIARTIAASSSLFFLALTTPMTELFIAMRWLRIPQVIIEIAMLIYRYIFVFLEEAERMWIATKIRGEGGFITRIKLFSMLAGTLFLRTLQQGEKLIIAMNSRCYQGEMLNLASLSDEKRIPPHPFVVSAIILFELALVYLSLI